MMQNGCPGRPTGSDGVCSPPYQTMNESQQAPRGWFRKFAVAFRGVAVGVRGQSSFAVHLPATAAVLGLSWWLAVSPVEWCLLVLCIAVVLIAELFNSTLELLARAITTEHDTNLRDALDIAAGAVLLAAIGSAVVGAIILVPHLWQRFLTV